MPTNQALQVFYGSIPFMLVILGVYYREQLLMKSILERLTKLETKVDEGFRDLGETMTKIRERLAAVESKLGLSYVEN